MTAPTLESAPQRSELDAAEPPNLASKVVLGLYVGAPLTAVFIGVPALLGLGYISWLAAALLAVGYFISVHGVTIGYHRLFTHRSFKANRPLKVALALAGSVAAEGRLLDWVGDHRKHHKYSDKEDDPHSPWAYGPGARGLARGLLHAHMGWLFTYRGTDHSKYAPDIAKDRDLALITRMWPVIAGVALIAPAALGFVLGGWTYALELFFWASLVRVALVQHVTWSVNSVCHVWGKRPFDSRDHSANVAWLAPISGGESWHNYHHADPNSARHGALGYQLDTSALIIAVFERLGWARDVRWPDKARISGKLAPTAGGN